MNESGQFTSLRGVLIGTPETIIELNEQLAHSADKPQITGAVLLRPPRPEDRKRFARKGMPILGTVEDLERIVGPDRIDIALLSLPAVMSVAIQTIRTRLRRLGIADRFIPTLHDLLAGVGPRSIFECSVSDLIDRVPRAIDEESISRAVKGKRILITGAGGSIGSELARLVARFDPAELFLMERAENALFEIDRQIARAHPGLRRGRWLHDVTESQRTLAYCIAAKPQIIFHAAAHKHVPMMEDHPIAAVRNNFFGTKAIADAAAQTACERFVMISTDKAVNPKSIMGATKRLAELYVQYMNRASDTRFEMVRFGNVLASAGSVLTIWADQIRDGGPITVTHPEMTRYFMTIPEAAALVIQAASMPDAVTGGEVLLLDMGEPIRILDLAQRFIRAHGLEPVVADEEQESGSPSGHGETGSGHMPIVFTGIRPGEKLVEELAYHAEDMQPTAHPGIHVWKTFIPDPERISDMVATLLEAIGTGQSETVVTAIHRLLPEVQAPTVATSSLSRRRRSETLPQVA